MNEFLMQYGPYIAILLAFIGYVIYLVATKNWPGLRMLAYKVMLRVEKVYKDKGGEEKLNLVLDWVYKKYPLLDFLMDEITLKKKLQDWFDIAKDELDDGIRNNSI